MYNLLLVDDEPLIKVAFQSAVEWGKNGFLLAATASNGQEALHIVETQHIDAVITDLKMPGMDGLALIHELKKRSFTGPILVLSNYSDFDSVRTALTDGAYDYFLKINMNGESIGEHLEKMADLLRVQQQRQTEEDHRSFAIEAQKKENALIHCAQWITSTAGASPASNPFSMLPEPLVFPVRLFTVTLIPAKTHPMPALDAVTDLITEVFDEIGGKVFLHTHEDEICGLISNESLVASGRTLDTVIRMNFASCYDCNFIRRNRYVTCSALFFEPLNNQIFCCVFVIQEQHWFFIIGRKWSRCVIGLFIFISIRENISCIAYHLRTSKILR